jgi:hypothetical protein
MDMVSRGSIFAGVKAAAAFLGPAWRQAWGGMVVASLLFALGWGFGGLSPHSPWRGAVLLVLAAAAVAAEGGLYRLALGAGRPGPFGLQWGAAESRLAATWALSLLFLGVLGLLAFVAVLSLAFAVASAGHGFVVAEPATWARAVDGRGRAVVMAAASLCLAGMIWAGARISLGSAATIARGRIQVLATWPLTRGLVWTIVLGRAILGAAPIGLAIAILVTTGRTEGATLAARCAAGLAAGAAVMGLWLPFSTGFMAYCYERATAAPASDPSP